MIIKNVSEGWINLWVFANLSGVAAWNAVSYYNCLCHEDIPEASRISVANTHRLKPSFQSFVCMNVFIQIYWYTWVYIHILLLLFSLLNHVQLSATPWTVACQAPLSMGFSRQEYWSGLPLPSPGDLPESGRESTTPVLAGRFFTTEPPGEQNRVPGTHIK